MGVCIKANGKMIICKEKENLHWETEMCMKEISCKANLMDMVLWLKEMAYKLKVIESMDNYLDRDFKSELMETFMRGNFRREKNMDLVFLDGLMGQHILEIL